MAAPKKYGLIIPGKGTSLQKKPLQKLSVFNDDSDEEDGASAVNQSLMGLAKKTTMRKQTQIEVAKALQDDPTVYEYDSIYDDIQAKKDSFKPAAKKEVEKKPKYIAGLLKAAEKRKKEDERRIERMVQKEREEEGEKFADKEAFVTTAYKKKMQEMQEAEEKERREAELEAKNDVTKQEDMSGFYRHILNQRTGGPESTDKQPTEATVGPETTEEDNQSTEGRVKEEPIRIKTEKKNSKSYRKRRTHSESESDDDDDITERSSERQLDKSDTKGAIRNSGKSERRDKDKIVDSKKQGEGKRDKEPIRETERTKGNKYEKVSEETSGRKNDQISEIKTEKPQSDNKTTFSEDEDDVSDGDENPDADSPNESSSEEEEESKPSKSKPKQKLVKKDTVENRMAKFARRNVGETLNEARARYFARKQARIVVISRD